MLNAILDVTYGVSDIKRACQFYDAAPGALGIERNPHADEGWACWGPDSEADGVGFCICKPFDGEQCTAGNGTMVTFAAQSAEAVRAFHSAALANGGSDEGAPGTRACYSPTFYVAYARDPDGNKLAAAFYRYVAEDLARVQQLSRQLSLLGALTRRSMPYRSHFRAAHGWRRHGAPNHHRTGPVRSS